MKQVPVIYWSGTGNTQMMAEAVAAAITEAGAEALLKEVTSTSADEAAQYEAIALGCPAMGCEVLEECDFEPFFTELEGKLGGKKVGLFGSYGWGGDYMQAWQDRVNDAGAELVADGVLAMGTPDDEALAKCAELGKLLAQ